jgi:hypothetical protein
MIRKDESLTSIAEQSERAMRAVSPKVTKLAEDTNTSIIIWDYKRNKIVRLVEVNSLRPAAIRPDFDRRGVD